MRNIAIIGRRGSGKTTVAERLVSSRQFVRHSWAAPVKEIASWAYGPIEKSALYDVTVGGSLRAERTGRWILQRIGTEALRDSVDQDFWIKVGTRALDTATDGRRRVNDDSRFPNELAALRARGFVIVYLRVPDDVRRQRLGLETAEFEMADSHTSETSVTSRHADISINGLMTPVAIEQFLADLSLLE